MMDGRKRKHQKYIKDLTPENIDKWETVGAPRFLYVDILKDIDVPAVLWKEHGIFYLYGFWSTYSSGLVILKEYKKDYGWQIVISKIYVDWEIEDNKPNIIVKLYDKTYINSDIVYELNDILDKLLEYKVVSASNGVMFGSIFNNPKKEVNQKRIDIGIGYSVHKFYDGIGLTKDKLKYYIKVHKNGYCCATYSCPVKNPNFIQHLARIIKDYIYEIESSSIWEEPPIKRY